MLLSKERRLRTVEAQSVGRFARDPFALPGFDSFARELSAIAGSHGLQIRSCAERPELASSGIQPGKCIDEAWIRAAFGVTVSAAHDHGQREGCGCVKSCDIAAVDSCLHGCAYCYATRSQAAAARRYARHDVEGPMLIPTESIKHAERDQP